MPSGDEVAMKLNPDFPGFDEILKAMSNAETGSVKRVVGTETPEENAEATMGIKEIARDPNAVRVLCIACQGDNRMVDTKPCVCGGWVCANCEAIEEDGVCEHEVPSLEEMAESAADVSAARDEAQRSLTVSLGNLFDDLELPQNVRINIGMSIVANSLFRVANQSLEQAQATADRLAQSLLAMKEAQSVPEMEMAVEKFARHIPKDKVSVS
jgi:hypothetical protein